METDYPEVKWLQETRRQFLRTAIVGGGAAVLGTALWPLGAFAAGHTDVLLLNCMDYRLVGKTRSYMVRRGLGDQKYDHIVLAGASPGAGTRKIHWRDKKSRGESPPARAVPAVSTGMGAARREWAASYTSSFQN